jgi:hypothetical protein
MGPESQQILYSPKFIVINESKGRAQKWRRVDLGEGFSGFHMIKKYMLDSCEIQTACL